MGIRNGLLTATVLIVILELLCSSADGWSNGGYSDDPDEPDKGTHDWIADKALTLQTRDVSHFETTYHNSYLIGTEAPDNPAYIGDFMNHHVYYYSDGSLQDDASAKRAKAMYESASARLISGDFEAAAYYMGAMTHYISDVGVFGHTMGSHTDWGDEEHHADYEGQFESMLLSLTLPPTVTLGDSSAYDATLDLARDITFGSGTIKSNVWMDDNYDWSDSAFEASAMASLHRSVYAAAAAINHLLTATASYPDEPVDPGDVTPVLEAPDAPASLDAYVQGGHVFLVWSPPANDGGSPVIEYVIYRGTELNSPQPLATAASNAQSWQDLSADEGETYYYWVVARNSAGPSGMSEVASATLPRSDDANPLFWPAAFSVAFAALVSAGAVVWRRRNRAMPRT
ncbi:MAG: zinc dependent phospholipase C family protein [Candidatus Thermoplasmatota archaeon]|nr:zinc dependent phospholipase C family protein [Candidatus Thermoplasmatota archaeon]